MMKYKRLSGIPEIPRHKSVVEGNINSYMTSGNQNNADKYINSGKSNSGYNPNTNLITSNHPPNKSFDGYRGVGNYTP